MRFLIVYAHHEPGSFNGAMRDRAVAALRAAGHEVEVSDLHAMAFDPVSDRHNFVTVKNPQRLKQQEEEQFAFQHRGFTPMLQAEMDKVAWCDVLVLQFPLWWLGLPAILKGWVDRVFAAGFAYGGGRYFATGVFAGKRALCALTAGGSQTAFSPGGMYGSIDAVLFPVHHGIFAFSGFEVLEPFVAYAPSRMDDGERATTLDAYAQRLIGIGAAQDAAAGDAPQLAAHRLTAAGAAFAG